MAPRGLRHMIVTVSLVAGLFVPTALYSQEARDGEYLRAYARKDYKSALETIQRRLGEIYDSRVQDRRIPVDFITSKRLEEKLDLNALYKKRTLTGFFLRIIRSCTPCISMRRAAMLSSRTSTLP